MQDLFVLFGFLLSGLSPDISKLVQDLLSSQSFLGDKSLDLGGLLSLLSILVGPGSPDDVLLDESNTDGFLDAEESSQFAESLGSEPSGNIDGGDTYWV